MDFEWDEAKRLEVLRERMVDFRLMTQVFRDPDRFEGVDDRIDYGERRLVTIGKIQERYYVVVYVMRRDVCRIITAWSISENGLARYKALFAKRNR